MIRPILISLFLFLPLVGISQFSASAGYRWSMDGRGFHQNHYNTYVHFQRPRRFHFSVGLESTYKQLDYSSIVIESDYDHGPPGYSSYEEDKYSQTAKVTYFLMSGSLFYDWALIDQPNFDLLFGFFVKLNAKVNESEKEHTNTVEHYYSTGWAGEYSSYSETDPISYETFDAIYVNEINGQIGLKASARKHLNQMFIQFDMSAGRTAQRIFLDLQKSPYYYSDSNNFEYEFLFGRKNPFTHQLGFRLVILFNAKSLTYFLKTSR